MLAWIHIGACNTLRITLTFFCIGHSPDRGAERLPPLLSRRFFLAILSKVTYESKKLHAERSGNHQA